MFVLFINFIKFVVHEWFSLAALQKISSLASFFFFFEFRKYDSCGGQQPVVSNVSVVCCCVFFFFFNKFIKKSLSPMSLSLRDSVDCVILFLFSFLFSTDASLSTRNHFSE